MAALGAAAPPPLLAQPAADGDKAQRQQPLLLVTTVDIGAGCSDVIQVRAGDDPGDVAAAFASKHGLPPAIIPRLAAHLQAHLAPAADHEQGQQQQQQQHGSAGGANEDAAAGGSEGEEHDDGSGDGGGEDAVFARLYRQALCLRSKLEERRAAAAAAQGAAIAAGKQPMSWISAEMMKDRGPGAHGSYGEMLYAEAREAEARRRTRAEARAAELSAAEVAGATFRPEVSRLAHELWASQEYGSVPAWQRLSKVKLSKAEERLEALRREKEAAELAECTFRPSLNSRSERMMSGRAATLRSLNVSAHQQLYQDAVRRQQRQAEYEHWFPEEVTFRPTLTASSNSNRGELAGSKEGGGAGGSEERHLALVSRLYASYDKLQAKLAEARSSLARATDPATGRRLFHPDTGRAPAAGRNAGQLPVGEYLYGLQSQRDAKAAAAAAEAEWRRREEAERAKQSAGSRPLVKALQGKRFRQIFDFLDQTGAGVINLAELMGAPPAWLDDLDDEVRSDLDAAAKLAARRGALQHTDSTKSDGSEGSSIFMPPPPSLMLPGAGASSGSATSAATHGAGSAPASPGSRGPPGVVDFTSFATLMESVLAARRGPRAYLAPSPPRRPAPAETHAPRIDARSKQLAAKLRPKDTPAYEVLYAESSAISARLSERRAAVEAAEVGACTFAPRLVAQQLVKEGRVMKGVREGTWYQKPPAAEDSSAGSIPDDADSLQALAAAVAACPPPPARRTQAPPSSSSKAGAAAVHEAPSAESSYAARSQHGSGSSSSSSSRAPRGKGGVGSQGARAARSHDLEALEQQIRDAEAELQLLQATARPALEQEQQLAATGCAAGTPSGADASSDAAAAAGAAGCGVAGDAGAADADAASDGGCAGGTDDDGFEGSEEHRAFLELEAEVGAMLEATAAAAAVAERLQSGPSSSEGGDSEAAAAAQQQQAYLADLLGLAQAQVDAMAPELARLQARVSRSRSSGAGSGSGGRGSAAGDEAAAAEGSAAVRGTPTSSFKVCVAAQAAAEELGALSLGCDGGSEQQLPASTAWVQQAAAAELSGAAASAGAGEGPDLFELASHVAAE